MSTFDVSTRQEDEQFADNRAPRHRSSRIWLGVFAASTIVCILALSALMYNVINGAFGLAAIEDSLDRATLAVDGVSIEEQSADQLQAVLREHVRPAMVRRLETERPFAERSREQLLGVVLETVVQPRAERTWPLDDSLLRRRAIEAEHAADFPGTRLEFVSWLSPSFVSRPQSGVAENAGVRTALLGSLWTIAITVLFAFPFGLGAAVYLEEYADHRRRINRVIQTNINNLAGVPSIIYGMLGLAIFVRAFEPFTSGAFMSAGDATTANGRTILSAGLTLALLVLPLIIINSQEAIRAVPSSLRQASFGLGATRWQTIWNHVLPAALPGILTGTILSISRAIGETAPLVVIGASTAIFVDPSGPFSKFTTLPIQVYQWTSRPQDEFRNIAAAAILVLLILLLTLNATAVVLRNRFSVRY